MNDNLTDVASGLAISLLTTDESKERIKDIVRWCESRIDVIKKGNAIAPLEDLPQLVIHLVPFLFDDPIVARTVDDIQLQHKLLCPIERAGFDQAYNADGYLTYSRLQGAPHDKLRGYVQFFRSGQIESVRSVPSFDKQHDHLVIHGGILENDLLLAVNDYLAAMKNVGVSTPILLKAKLLKVQGCRLATRIDLNGFNPATAPFIDREEVDLPPVLLSEYPSENELPIKMMSLIDSIWNAAGYRKSPYHDTMDGDRLMPRRGSY